ncbi:MAG: glycosyltransferase family 2 protein [Bacteroidetes bacterium]|nr:glycosyltransferase family 2 protein [Bacteroidota bacterium]
MKISIIAPMYNEQDNLLRTLTEIKNELSLNGFSDYEIIFVNDGSTDSTWDIAKELEKKEDRLKVLGYPVNQGRGKAMRIGFDAATGDIIVTIDFDLSYDTSHITVMVRELIENDHIDAVLASAYMPGGKTINVPFFRLLASKLGNYVYRSAFSSKVYTSTCIVRAYRKEVIKGLLLESDDKEIHLEILSKVLANGHKIMEIPATLTRRSKGRSKFRFRATSFTHIIYLLHEKPFFIFGFFGLILMFLGFISTFIILYTRFSGDVEFARTFIGRLVSPNFVLILFLGGIQMLGLGFLGIQNNILKKELFKLQKQIKTRKEI